MSFASPIVAAPPGSLPLELLFLMSGVKSLFPAASA